MDKQHGEVITEVKPITLSDHIRAWRQSARLSIEDIALQTGAQPRMISAFEEGNLNVFPAYVYAAGYLRRMISHFSISSGEILLDALKTEWEEKQGNTQSSIRRLPHSRRKKWYITPRRLFGVCGVMLFLFFVWLLITHLMGFTGAPVLIIDEPLDAMVRQKPFTRIKGSTEKESQLTVNGREITMHSDGTFDGEIELSYGLNALYFLVKNRFGKSSEEVRYVVVR